MQTKLLHKKKLVLGGLIAILVISSFMYFPVIGDSDDEDEDGIPDDEDEDDDNDSVDDETELENEREVEFELSNNEAKIESSIRKGETHNEFEISMKTGDEGLEFEFEYTEDNNTVETELEFEVKLTEIVEYIDNDADGIYNKSVDEDIQTYKIDDFKPIEYSTMMVDNDTVHVFYVETIDGVVSGKMFVTGEFTIVNDVLVAPTQIKIDIGIHNFNYTELDSVLALKVKLESEIQVDYEEDDETEDEEDGRATDESEIEVSLGDYTGFFSWIETAIIDGIEHEVKVTPLEIDLEEKKLYLNYPRGTEIIHDPKIGIANVLEVPNTAFVGSNDLLIFGVVAMLAITGLTLFFKKRKS